MIGGHAGAATLVPSLAGLTVVSVVANGLVTLTSAGGDDVIHFINSAIAVGDYVSVGTATGLHVFSGFVTAVTSATVIVVMPTAYTIPIANLNSGVRFLSA